MVTRWSRSTSNFYALIGQNLTGEFMRKIYATSWNLLTLTAEADRVLCQLVMFFSVFFHWMYQMKYSWYQASSVIHGWFVYWVFGWEMPRLSKSETRFRITWDQAQFERFSFILSNGYRWNWASLFVSPCPPECYLRAQFMRQVNYARL